MCASKNNVNSSFYADCLAPKSNSATVLCDEPNSRCYTLFYSDIVTRSCSSLELIAPGQNRNNLEECSSSLCNNFTIENTCIECNMDSDLDCLYDPISQPHKICSLKSASHPEYSACFKEIDQNGILHRGCLNNLSDDDQENCLNSTSRCEACFGTNCNQKLSSRQTCYLCEGNADVDCETFNSEMETVDCPNYQSSCLTGIDSSGYIHRGCSTNPKDDGDHYSGGFELCFDERCNNKNITSPSLQCYQCGVNDDCDFNEGPVRKYAAQCNHRMRNNQCYVYFDAGNFECFSF